MSKKIDIPKPVLERAISNGKTQLDVALSFECCRSTVGHKAKEYGLEWPDHHKNVDAYYHNNIRSAETRKAIRDAYKNGTNPCPLA
jgi:hypothetical protein